MWIVSADGEECSLIFTEVRMGLFDLVCAKVAEAHKPMNEARELVKQDLKDEKSTFVKLTKTLEEIHFGSKLHWKPWGKIRTLCYLRCFREDTS